MIREPIRLATRLTLALLVLATADAWGSSRDDVNEPSVKPPIELPGGEPGGGECVAPLSVCYYDLCEEEDEEAPGGGGGSCLAQGDPDQEPPILLAGHLPVFIADPDAATLAGCDLLFAQNSSNNGYNEEWNDNLAAIAARIQQGMILVFHDRTIDSEDEGSPAGGGLLLPGTAMDYIPGLASASCIRDFSDEANVDVVTGGTAVTDGPAGTIDDTSLDGGTSSSHGYCQEASLPAGSTNFLSRTVDTESVAFAYPLGAGAVYYSTMPLDFYLDGSGPEPPLSNFTSIYAPNVLTYAAGLSPACNPLSAIQEIPTLSTAGLALLGAFLGLGSFWLLRRRALGTR